jgi:hypothetical protein
LLTGFLWDICKFFRPASTGPPNRNNPPTTLKTRDKTAANVPLQSSSPIDYTLPSGFGPAVSLAAGRSHVCARSAAGAVACWGAAVDANGAAVGQIGQTTSSLTPISVSFGPGVVATAISAGRDTTCILTSAGKQLCIGDNSRNQMGIGSPTGPFTTPQQALPAAGAAVDLGQTPAPAFLTLARAGTGQTCNVQVSVSFSITCERSGFFWRFWGRGGPSAIGPGTN